MLATARYTRGQVIDPWRLVRTVVEADPSAGDYGLLDSRLTEEPELPHEGLLSQVSQAQGQAGPEERLFTGRS